MLRGEPLATLDPSDELLHLVNLAREKGLAQRGAWPLKGGNLDVRMMPGNDGWVAVVLQGRNPLESQLEQQEQWVSDVAHELKTPLTALRLVGDSLAIKAEGRQAVLVVRLQRELERLQVLVSDLLDLSRLDNTPFNDAAAQAAVDPLRCSTTCGPSSNPSLQCGVCGSTSKGAAPTRRNHRTWQRLTPLAFTKPS